MWDSRLKTLGVGFGSLPYSFSRWLRALLLDAAFVTVTSKLYEESGGLSTILEVLL